MAQKPRATWQPGSEKPPKNQSAECLRHSIPVSVHPISHQTGKGDPYFQMVEKLMVEDQSLLTGRDRAKHDRMAEFIGGWEQEKGRLKTFLNGEHELGTVFAGSGLDVTKRVTDGETILDWALIG